MRDPRRHEGFREPRRQRHEPMLRTQGHGAAAQKTTLLDLVFAVQDFAESDTEVVQVISHLLRTRRVILCGTFAGETIEIGH
jgi:hypothetical protein